MFKMSNIIEVEYIKNDLSPSWFIEGSIDFESKVYTLMAFLKKAENNIYHGHWFPDFEIIENRYKDLESFIESSEIVYSRQSDRKLFEYIYDLPENSVKMAEINKIAMFAHRVFGEIYYELKARLDYLIDNIKVFNKIKDKRVKPIFYIEQSDSDIIESYTVGKKVVNNGYFYADSYNFLYEESNYVQIISDICISSERCLIPIARRLIESGDCF
jgi:hypothetical protein